MDNILKLIEESNDMILENYNAFAELQAAFYLEDLVIEHTIFKDYTEEKYTSLTEAVNNERKVKLRARIQEFCRRIVNMINTFIEAIQNMFMKTEKFVEKYGAEEIKEAMRNCDEQIEGANIYNPIGLAVAKIKYLQERIRIDDIETTEDIWLALKVKDKDHLETEIKEIFINRADVDLTVNRINSATAIGYLTEGRGAIDLLRKTQKQVTNDANRVINIIQRSDEIDSDKISACQTAMGTKMFILQKAINYVDDAVKEHAKIAKKAMGYKYLKDKKE